MYKLKVKTSFSAAHQLLGYNGECEELHGHNWKIEVSICINELNNIGIGIDFKEIKSITNNILSELDHHNLNETIPFKTENPSSENIAKWLYEKLEDTETLKEIIKKVTVYETDNFSASYYKP